MNSGRFRAPSPFLFCWEFFIHLTMFHKQFYHLRGLSKFTPPHSALLSPQPPQIPFRLFSAALSELYHGQRLRSVRCQSFFQWQNTLYGGSFVHPLFPLTTFLHSPFFFHPSGHAATTSISRLMPSVPLRTLSWVKQSSPFSCTPIFFLSRFAPLN